MSCCSSPSSKATGFGLEVVQSAVDVLRAAAEKCSLKFELVDLPIGFAAYKEFGRTLPPETLQTMRQCDGWILGPLSAGSLSERRQRLSDGVGKDTERVRSVCKYPAG